MKLNLSLSKPVAMLCCLVIASLVSSCKKDKPVVPGEDEKPKSIVYFGSHNKDLYALNAETGELVWKYESSIGGFQYSAPVVADGMLYAGSTDSNYYAFNAETGVLKWKFDAGRGIESPGIVSNGIVYFGSNDDNLYAVNAKTGILLWKYTTGANVSTKPVIVNGTIYFASSDSSVYALDALTGEKKWSYPTSDFIVFSSPAYSNGYIYIGGRTGKLYVIDAITGKRKQRFLTNGTSLEHCTPVIIDGVIYTASGYNPPQMTLKGSLYARSESTGELLWEKLNGLAFSRGPYVTDNNIVASADDGYMYVLNRVDGNIKWKKEILPNGSMPVVANNTVYTGGARFFYAFDTETGKLRWKYPIPGGSTSAPCVIDTNGNIVH